MREDEWLVVLNPVSGRGRALRHRGEIERLLERNGMRSIIAISEYHGHAIEIVAQAVRAGCRRVLAAGGDGSLNEAANGVLCQDAVAPGEVTLAALPVGTGNDWARGQRVPREWDAALALAASGRTAVHDIGVADFADGARRWFVNVAGLGFDAEVIADMPDRRWGALAYLLGLLRALAASRPARVAVSVDGAAAAEHSLFVLFACLGAYCGGGMLIAPEAEPQDGRFDCALVRHMSRLEVLRDVRRLFDGTLGSHPKVRMLHAARLQVTAATPVGVETDGELVGRTPVTFSVLPRTLRFAVPSGAPPPAGG